MHFNHKLETRLKLILEEPPFLPLFFPFSFKEKRAETTCDIFVCCNYHEIEPIKKSNWRQIIFRIECWTEMWHRKQLQLGKRMTLQVSRFVADRFACLWGYKAVTSSATIYLAFSNKPLGDVYVDVFNCKSTLGRRGILILFFSHLFALIRRPKLNSISSATFDVIHTLISLHLSRSPSTN